MMTGVAGAVGVTRSSSSQNVRNDLCRPRRDRREGPSSRFHIRKLLVRAEGLDQSVRVFGDTRFAITSLVTEIVARQRPCNDLLGSVRTSRVPDNPSKQIVAQRFLSTR